MSRKNYTILPTGRAHEHTPKHPERTARYQKGHFGEDTVIQEFTSREFMARMIRNEERTSPATKWTAYVPLKSHEGY